MFAWDTVFAPNTIDSPLPDSVRAAEDENHNLALARSNVRRRISAARYAASSIGRSSLRTLERLRNYQAGDVGIIVANGPSLKQTDLSFLATVPYVLMNRGYILEGKTRGEPAALCAHDPDVVATFAEQLELINAPLFLPSDSATLFTRREDAVFLRWDPDWRFAQHLGLSSHHGYTVAFWAMQVAFHLGWSTALIIGMDHRFRSISTPGAEVHQDGKDSDHFDPSYFTPGMRLRSPILAASEYSYQLARNAWESAGRRIIDCTVGGECQIFQKSTLEAEISRIKP